MPEKASEDKFSPNWHELWTRYVDLALFILTGALLTAGGLFHLTSFADSLSHILWITSGAIGAAYALWSMVEGLLNRRLGVDAIALLALVGALVVGEDLAAAVIALMLASGRALESWAARRARHDLSALLARASRSARRYDESGDLSTVPIEIVAPGDLLIVGSGEVVPVDGNLLAPAVLDESALTGESLPIERAIGEPVRSGVVNAGRPFDLRATTSAEQSTYSGILRLVADAESSQAPFVRMADRYALWFVPVTLFSSAMAWLLGGASRAVAVLVVATPCPLILAAPIALVSGLSLAARRGVVIKGGGVLERLARCTTALFDKTGTLTMGDPALSAVVTAPGVATEHRVLQLAGSIDQVSAHVLAHAVVRAALEQECDLILPERVEEIAGQGIRGVVDNHTVALGKAAWVGISDALTWVKSARRRAELTGSLTVFVSIDEVPAGVMIFDDPIRLDASRTIRSLRESGISRIVLVSGDRSEVAEAVGAEVGVDTVLSECSPTNKLEVVRSESGLAPTIMVGDGINDAPALALADVGIALGAKGATASSETADVVLTVDKLDRVGEARRIAQRSRSIAVQSVLIGMTMSLVAMGVAAAGMLPAVWGAVLQEGIDVAVILNALRALLPSTTVSS